MFGKPNFFEKKVYVKDESFDPIYHQVNTIFFVRSRLLPSFLIFAGLSVLVTQIMVPLVFFKTTDSVAKPVSTTVLGVASGFSAFSFDELNSKEKVLGTTSENHAVANLESPAVGNVPDSFTISIPKLDIEDARVETNSPDLSPDNYIGHYIGSALPGEIGNVYLYGHSVLPFFYNPNNYKTVFSTLNKLEPGDMYEVRYNNKIYSYKVEGIEVLKIDEVQPLATFKPAYLNKSTMTLMTCWPPGTKSKRLEVRAVLVE